MFQEILFFFFFFFSFLLNAWLDFNTRPTLESAYLGSDSVTVYKEQKEEVLLAYSVAKLKSFKDGKTGRDLFFLNGGIFISGLWV